MGISISKKFKRFNFMVLVSQAFKITLRVIVNNNIIVIILINYHFGAFIFRLVFGHVGRTAEPVLLPYVVLSKNPIF